MNLPDFEEIQKRSDIELSRRQPELYRQYPQQWVALLYEPNANPIIEIGPDLEKLLDTVEGKHGKKWEYFAYSHLICPNKGNIEGH